MNHSSRNLPPAGVATGRIHYFDSHYETASAGKLVDREALYALLGGKLAEQSQAPASEGQKGSG